MESTADQLGFIDQGKQETIVFGVTGLLNNGQVGHLTPAENIPVDINLKPNKELKYWVKKGRENGWTDDQIQGARRNLEQDGILDFKLRMMFPFNQQGDQSVQAVEKVILLAFLELNGIFTFSQTGASIEAAPAVSLRRLVIDRGLIRSFDAIDLKNQKGGLFYEYGNIIRKGEETAKADNQEIFALMGDSKLVEIQTLGQGERATKYLPPVQFRSGPIEYTTEAATNVGGRLRDEDALGIRDAQTADGQTVVIAYLGDGMGGQAGGKETAQQVREVVMEQLAQYVTHYNFYALNNSTREMIIRNAVIKAHRIATGEHSQQGGTTAEVVLLVGNQYSYGHLGDSRIMERQDEKGTLVRLTRDQTPAFANYLADHDQAAFFRNPQINKLMQSVGVLLDHPSWINTGSGLLSNKRAELLLLCDGVWEQVKDVEGDVLTPALRPFMQIGQLPQFIDKYGRESAVSLGDNLSMLRIRRTK